MMQFYLYQPNTLVKASKKVFDLLSDKVANVLACHTEFFDYDFNSGFRIRFKDVDREYRVLLTDKNTGQVYWDGVISPIKDAIYSYAKRYLIEYKVAVFIVEYGVTQYPPIENITFDLNNEDVLFLLSGDDAPTGLGDSIAWAQPIALIKEKFPDANIYVHSAFPDFDKLLNNTNAASYIRHVRHDEITTHDYYATYHFGVFYCDKDFDHSRNRFTRLSMVEMAADVLNTPLPQKHSPLIYTSFSHDKPEKHYVCIGAHASSVAKEWLPIDNGKDKVVEYLKDMGYDVYAIDMVKTKVENPLISSDIPKGAIDLTGDNYNLIDRAKFISKADFVIGYSSGISWLAWMCRVPVVLISGFTHPITEFENPYRIYNYTVCNGCWNDEHKIFDVNNIKCKFSPFSGRFLECSTSITSTMVIKTIQQIPAFQEYTRGKTW